jgi:hypothetical protein
MSSALCKAIREKGGKFDIWVDEKDRTIGLCPSEKGEYRFETVPACVGASELVRKVKPLMMTRLHVVWLNPEDSANRPGMWVTSLDGNKEVE